MKTGNYFLIYVTVAFLASLPFSNSFSQSKIQAGPFWGQEVRMVSGNSEFDMGPGYHGGIMASIPFEEKFSFVPSISVSRKGFYKIDIGRVDEDDVHSSNQKLTYFDIYIPLKYQVARLFTVQAGFQTGLLLDGTMVIENFENDGKHTENIKGELNPVEFGFLLGGGVQFKNGMGLDLIVNQGLTSIYEDSPPLYYDQYDGYYFGSEFDGKNTLVTINVYYLFGYAKPAVK